MAEFHFGEITGDCYSANERYYINAYTSCRRCLNIFTEIKQRRLKWCLCPFTSKV